MVKMLEVVRKKSKDKIVFFITLLNNTYQNGKKKKEYKEAKVTVFLLSKHRIGFFYLGDFFYSNSDTGYLILSKPGFIITWLLPGVCTLF